LPARSDWSLVSRLVNLLNDAAKTPPDRPLISIQLDADVDNEPAADPAQPARQRARRKGPGEHVAANVEWLPWNAASWVGG
jgi:hypothetical protein